MFRVDILRRRRRPGLRIKATEELVCVSSQPTEKAWSCGFPWFRVKRGERREGIRRKEKIARLRLCKAWNGQRKVRSERTNWIEGTGNVTTLGEGTGQKVSGSCPVRSRAMSVGWGWKIWWVLREGGGGAEPCTGKQRVWVCLWSPRRWGGAAEGTEQAPP